MTKLEVSQVKMARFAVAQGMEDYAARLLAILIRAGSPKSQRELMTIANELGLINHAEFII